ncbi:hypothetical protein [Pseudomonas vancouverensis]|uniref:Uncharacterized protein n=1 Tax=Pseudomonas vancouverensis TaxID=95300 RepID=A0A1H2MKK5_PSEVA|nr:hypothetical protein [Pseudomonas vancouverensis]KAB0494779.1 hypothetical protein F7R09_19220 [Pseudomonas vancouverensis]TDB63579.1 hypothetical protein EIY72_12900 [Pseudomonas vancouverensis]SDU93451.1 hypothetical protein SAMN05216558_0875 [Pseudomonas vancouverensis]
MSGRNSKSSEEQVKAHGWCRRYTDPVTPNRMSMTQRNGLLVFEGYEDASQTSPRKLVSFDLAGDIQSGTYHEWAPRFSIYVYESPVIHIRGVDGFIKLEINYAAQEFNCRLEYRVRAPDQTIFDVAMQVELVGFNQMIIPSSSSM